MNYATEVSDWIILKQFWSSLKLKTDVLVSCKFTKKETLSQVLWCEFDENFKGTFFIECLRRQLQSNIISIILDFNNIDFFSFVSYQNHLSY